MVYTILESMPELINGIRMIARSSIGGAVVMIKRPSIIAFGEASASEPSS